MLGNLQPIDINKRSCGGCTACCKVLGIEELSKPPHTPCKHCSLAGCDIYESRPSVCRNWFCFWRVMEGIPENARPDKIGVIISFETYDKPEHPFEKAYIIVRAIDNQDVFDDPTVRSMVEIIINEGSLPVWTGFEGRKKLIYPDTKFADAILNPSTTKWKDLVPKAIDWRIKYGME